MRVSIITVNYKQAKHLHDMVNSIDAQTQKELFTIDVIVVDNSGEYEPENNAFKVNYISQDNLGYLAGLRTGFNSISYDTQFHDHVVVLCNPDLIFPSNFLTLLEENITIIKEGIVGPKIICNGLDQNPNKELKPSALWYYIQDLEMSNYVFFILIRKLKNWIRRLKIFIRQKNSIEISSLVSTNRKIYLLHGSCMITTYQNIVLTNCLEGELFLWGEEALICSSFRRQGRSITYCPNISVAHEEHTATNDIPNFKRYKIWKNSYLTYRYYL